MYKDFLEIPLATEWWFLAAFAWVFVWKGLALWRAARLGVRWWFIALLVVNTFGVLEILYLFVFSKRKSRTKFEPEGGKEEMKEHQQIAHDAQTGEKKF